jgi:hypothetical protein
LETEIKPRAFIRDHEVVAPVEDLNVGDIVRFDPNDPNYPADRVIGLELIESGDFYPIFPLVRVTHESGVWSKALGELVAIEGRVV